MHTASWVIRDRSTKAVVCETFNPLAVRALNTEKYEALPIQQYLSELNTKTDEHAELISRDGWESESEMERRTR